MAWLAPWLFGFVIVLLYLFMTGLSPHDGAEVPNSLWGLRLRRVRAGREEGQECMMPGGGDRVTDSER